MDKKTLLEFQEAAQFEPHTMHLPLIPLYRGSQ